MAKVLALFAKDANEKFRNNDVAVAMELWAPEKSTQWQGSHVTVSDLARIVSRWRFLEIKSILEGWYCGGNQNTSAPPEEKDVLEVVEMAVDLTGCPAVLLCSLQTHIEKYGLKVIFSE